MSNDRTSLSDEQLSDLIRDERKKGGDRVLGFVFFGAIMAVAAGCFVSSHFGVSEFLVSATIVLCAGLIAVVTF